MEKNRSRPVTQYAVPLALIAAAGIAGVFIAFSPEPARPADSLPGLTYELEPLPARRAYALIVTSVADNSPAEAANVAVGDVIDEIDGRPISSPSYVYEEAKLDKRKVPPQVQLRLRRSGHEVEARLPLQS